MKAEDSYADIIDIAYPVPTDRPRMSIQDRAAQFSPFAALSGLDSMIGETARFTDGRIELDESSKTELDRALSSLQAKPGTEVTVTFFRPDRTKAGGTYITLTDCIRKVDELRRLIVMKDNSTIPMDDIISLLV